MILYVCCILMVIFMYSLFSFMFDRSIIFLTQGKFSDHGTWDHASTVDRQSAIK